MSYVDLKTHPVEQAPFVFHGIPFDDVNPEEDEKPLWSQTCEEHYNNHQTVLQPIVEEPCKPDGSICGVYGCENTAKYMVLFDKENLMGKRFRDSKGKLTMTIEEIVEITKEESRKYYIPGNRYQHDGKLYILKSCGADKAGMLEFASEDGHGFFTDSERMGTFLPDVASIGDEITLVTG